MLDDKRKLDVDLKIIESYHPHSDKDFEFMKAMKQRGNAILVNDIVNDQLNNDMIFIGDENDVYDSYKKIYFELLNHGQEIMNKFM